MKKLIASVMTAIMLMTMTVSCSPNSPNSTDKIETTPDKVVDSNTDTDKTTAPKTENAFGLIEEGIIHVATSPDYPPFEFLDNNEITGFDVELLNAVAAKSGLEVKFAPLDFESIIIAVQAGQFDMGMSAFTATEDRAKSVLFSDTYYYSAQVALLPLDSEVETLEDLAGKKLGAGMGTTGELAALELSDNVELVVTSVGFPMLLSGQLDAYVCDIGVATNAVGTGKYKVIETPISEENTAMVFKLGNTALADELNASLAEFMASDEYTALLEKYELK